jgi:hypothetical protein
MKAILRILLGTICAVLGASQTIALWAKEKAGSPIPVTGLAQVGVGGLSKVQVWIHPHDKEWPTGDPYFEKAPWADAKILPPPTDWGGDLPDGKLPPTCSSSPRKGSRSIGRCATPSPIGPPCSRTSLPESTTSIVAPLTTRASPSPCRAPSASRVPTPSRRPLFQLKAEVFQPFTLRMSRMMKYPKTIDDQGIEESCR